jgi:hypothetical protein
MLKKVTQDACNSGSLEKCTSSKFKRMNYFHGMLLTEEDFVDEQNYIREKLKLHNRLHGAGVIWGLRLIHDCIEVPSKDPAKKKTITKIFIEGGLALDCAGNEIVVCEKYLVPLDEKIDDLRCSGLLKKVEGKFVGPRLFIGIRYCECKSQPAEQYTSECADDKLRPQFSRVREGFNVQLFTADELPGCEQHKGSTNGCSHGCSHCCSECAGLHACSEQEQIIILGYVENYDVNTEDSDHKAANIAPHENCPTTPSHLGEPIWAYPRWESQKQSILRSVYTEAGWIDISVLIGKGKAEAEEWLKGKEFTVGMTYKSGSITNVREFAEKATRAQHWAELKSVIDLVTDKNEKCVLFLFVNPPRPLPPIPGGGTGHVEVTGREDAAR